MAQKTYWHLVDRRRIPTEYEVVSSRLAYHSRPEMGFELELPWRDWYTKYQLEISIRKQLGIPSR